MRRIAIVPMGFCYPGQDANGGDLPPRRECAPRWRQRLFEQLADRADASRRRLRAALASRERAGAGVTATVEDWRAILARSGRPRYLPLPHPSWRNNAWLKARPWFEEELVPRLRAEVRGLLA